MKGLLTQHRKMKAQKQDLLEWLKHPLSYVHDCFLLQYFITFLTSFILYSSSDHVKRNDFICQVQVPLL